MNTDDAPHGAASLRQFRRVLLGNVCVLAVAIALGVHASPASAKPVKHRPSRGNADHISKEPFGQLPKGPLQIVVSINEQKLHFYAGGELIADALVATGVPGHLTPMGVFSVIERDRYHHSNIYDNAPMPFMERITWSGVALHEGVGLGHPASHGCIRMPHEFAARLWQLPTIGMRVIIARPELHPTEFADSHLFVHKDTPTASLTPRVKTAQTNEPGVTNDAADPPASAAQPPASQAPRTNAAATPNPPAMANGAVPSSSPTKTKTPQSTATVQSAAMQPEPEASPRSFAEAAKSAAAKFANPKGAAEPAPSEPVKTTTAVRPSSAPGADTQPAAESPAITATVNAPAAPPSQPAAAALPLRAEANPPATAAPPPEAPPAKPVSANDTTPPAPPAPAASAPKPSELENATTSPATVTAPIAIDNVPMPLAKPAQIAKNGGGPIAIFISRKQGKIYVRQNFTPVFEAPVTIENPGRPLGTHVFTALDYMPDHAAFRWNVVSLPTEGVKVERVKYVKQTNGRRKRDSLETRNAEPATPPETPAEALARIQIPPDVMQQISQLIVPGSSLTVSDHDLGPETGSGTDFIVVTH